MGKDCADCDWRIADWTSRVHDFATSDALDRPFGRRIRNLHGQLRRTHPSRASGAEFEAVLGPAQF
eukprot:52355-Alexandrium_andersonii.AAC.1